MPLSEGSRLGPYEIVGRIGAGGMGEVWKARDPNLDRFVAVKILPPDFATDADRLKRFQQEAKVLATLNHPNLVQVFEAGEHEGAPYLVMELLEGEVLRERMNGGPLAAKRAAEIARGAALGLSAAHEKGILHRDLKPENLFLTKDGRVKLLDFGLAKFDLTRPIGQESTTRAFLSEPGTVVGTSGYMSPEQVRGENVDARSDLFSLGVILWEMVTGQRPFQGTSAVEVMHAILKEDPPELDERLRIAPALERILWGCLAKEPAGRFHSAHDLAFALEGVLSSNTSSGSHARALAIPHGWRGQLAGPGIFILLSTCLLLALGALGWMAYRERQRPPDYAFRDLTFRRGTITGARFGPDGKTIYYSAAWGGEPARIYSQMEGAQGTAVPDLPPAHLLAVSSTGELALSDASEFGIWGLYPGSLLLARPGVGVPRPVAQDVTAADFAPDGKSLAIAFYDFKRLESRLEFPLGTPLYTGKDPITGVRVAPDGQRVAFQIRAGLDTALSATWLAQTGRAESAKELLAKGWIGLAWAPSSQSLVTATGPIQELDLKGKRRPLFRSLGGAIFYDQDSNGRLLLGKYQLGGRAEFLDEKGQRRDLSWMDYTSVAAVSEDGATMLFTETGGGANYLGGTTVFLRPTSGAPPVQLCKGIAQDLSPDGRTALILSPEGKLILQPVGPGEVQEVAAPREGSRIIAAFFSPDGRICWTEADSGGEPHSLIRTPGQTPKPLGPGGFGVASISPDPRRMVVQKQGVFYLWDEGREAPSPLPLFSRTHWVIGWMGQENLLILRREPGRCQVEKLELTTGRVVPKADLTPSERGGLYSAWAYPCRQGRAWVVASGWQTVQLHLATPKRQAYR
jgi:hypothetical protein